MGVIPSDWIHGHFEDFLTGFSSGQTPSRAIVRYYTGDIPWITSGELNYNIIEDTIEKITIEAVKNTNLKIIPKGTFLIAITGLEAEGTRGSCAMTGIEATSNQSCMALYPKENLITVSYLFQFYLKNGNWLAFNYCQGTKQQSYTAGIAKKLPIVLPPTLAEQTAIASVLSDTDDLIRSLEQLIEKKKAIKQGMMQELLRPKKGWMVRRLGEIAEVLDNLRRPLNESQRSRMQGDIPYCGANGIVDYVNGYILDDEIILMAEDGGYFDEYLSRPIAYKMSGKCWVNNHAHILKAVGGFDQGFLFYSLVHKNILDYINSGTRAKLNKGELVNIEITAPNDKAIQNEISEALSVADAQITELELKVRKLNSIKQGMMQMLLTGKTRLI